MQKDAYIRILKPTGKHRSFRLLIERRKGGKKHFETLDTEEIRVVNAHYKNGTFDQSQALAQLRALRKRLDIELNGQPKAKPLTNGENMALLERYWKAEYSLRDISAPEAMRWDLERAIAILGDTPLATASQDELQRIVNERSKNVAAQRRNASRLNQLLVFAGRNFKLKRKKAEYVEPNYLTLNEVRILAKAVDEVTASLIWTAFGTGCRIGEVFALARPSLRSKDAVFIAKQLTRKLRLTQTKNRKNRKAAIIREAIPYVMKWIDVPEETRLAIRNKEFCKIVRRTAKKIWSKNPQKHIKFHELRDSYAIHMLNAGVPITLVAMMLGNSVEVCQRHYAGFTLTDEGLDAVRQILKA